MLLRTVQISLRRLFSASKYSDRHVLSRSEVASILGKNPTPVANNHSELQKINMPEAEKVELNELTHELPSTNEPFPMVQDEEESRISIETPNQNLYQLLQLNNLSSYQDYVQSIRTTFHNETDLYGDELPAPTVGLLQFNNLLTHNSKYLESIRSHHTININLPGTIQAEDPNNFLQLRPIEEFRHTPLIPIAESAMKKHKEMLEQYHRRAFVFEISTETIFNYALLGVAALICGYLVREVIKKEQEVAVSYQRLKYKRILGEDRKGSLL